MWKEHVSFLLALCLSDNMVWIDIPHTAPPPPQTLCPRQIPRLEQLAPLTSRFTFSCPCNHQDLAPTHLQTDSPPPQTVPLLFSHHWHPHSRSHPKGPPQTTIFNYCTVFHMCFQLLFFVVVVYCPVFFIHPHHRHSHTYITHCFH